MKCPKCKKIIEDNSLKCTFCGARIGSVCKKCNTYNSIYNLKCTNCQEELLKICPSCKSINFPNVEKCRKCGFSFVTGKPAQAKKVEDAVSEDIPANADKLIYEGKPCSQIKAKDILLKALKLPDKKIMAIIGEKGAGKSVVLKSAIAELREAKISWLLGECTAVTQLSPCGLIQDILLTFFNARNFCADGLQMKKNSQEFFHTNFPTLSTEEIFRLLNLIYPATTDFYENILINKEKTFDLLKKVFETITTAGTTIFVLDNFNQIDGLSYEFLSKLVNSDIINRNCKFILTYSEARPVRGYLYSKILPEDAYVNISLDKFDSDQITNFVNQSMDKKCPAAVLNQLSERCLGNPAKLEQYVSLAIDLEQRNNTFEMHLPLEYREVIKQRLEFLKYDDETAYEFLIASAIQGIKFCPSIISQVVQLPEEETLSVLVVLQQTNFILPVNEFSYSFRNSLLWTTILDIVKDDDFYSIVNEKMFTIFSNYTLSSHSILAIFAKNINQKLSALSAWTDCIKLASYIGDFYLYTIAQKQSLSIVEALEDSNSSLIKNNVHERLGKLISVTSPEEAKTYLPDAIANAQKVGNTTKTVELLGYLTQCCLKTGDYYPATECIDTVIEALDSIEYEVEIAVLKERKLKPLLKSGNCGQIIHLADNEILPVMERYINSKNLKNITSNTLYSSWLKTYQNLAFALAMQGSNRVFEVVATMFELFEKNKFEDAVFICKTKLILAFANTIKGDCAESGKILENILREYNTEILDSEAISIWNMTNILNKLERKNYTNIQEELFQLVTFANNVNDGFTKNILKAFLGKIFKEQGNIERALEIYNEQITYFAKEKNAIGALLSWYLIAEATLITEGADNALQVAVKALDVAQSPKINNYYFIILFNKLIAEAYISQKEYELAKAHIDKALMIARKFELTELMIRLYILYGKYLQKLAEQNNENSEEYLTNSAKMFNKAELLAKSIENTTALDDIEDITNSLNI
ncbi:hypothetical protein KBA27_04335 [bacterium]|nr:hypothetical protein [bacterium]